MSTKGENSSADVIIQMIGLVVRRLSLVQSSTREQKGNVCPLWVTPGQQHELLVLKTKIPDKENPKEPPWYIWSQRSKVSKKLISYSDNGKSVNK